MLKHLFRKIHARYAASANGALLEDFAGWLMSVGYARHATRGHVRRLNQVLDRLTSETLVREARISASFLSQAFASVSVQPPFQATLRTFERFLATHGQLLGEPESDVITTSLSFSEWSAVWRPLSWMASLTTATFWKPSRLRGREHYGTVIGGAAWRRCLTHQ
jgi:hypothetical protein